MGIDVATNCRQQYVACQHRKTSNRPPKLLVGHRPVSRPFQCVAVDLIEHKASKIAFHYVFHLTQFLILVPLKGKSMSTVTRALVDRVFSTFSAP